MSEYKRLTIKDTIGMPYQNCADCELHEDDACECMEDCLRHMIFRLAELEDKIEAGKLVELPFIAMIDRLMENGKFLATNKAQAFNGRYCVVRIIEDWKCPVIEICSEKSFNRVAAEARLKELEAKGK